MHKLEQEQKFDDHPLLCQIFALAPIYSWSECEKALDMGMLANQATEWTLMAPGI